MKKTMQFTFCFIAFLFLFACSHKEITYLKGLPKETSPALTDFITDYLMQRSNFLFITDENDYVFTERNGSYEDEKIHYFSTNRDEMEDFYRPILEDAEPAQAMKALYESVEDTRQSIQNNLPLPTISCLDNNMITIVSAEDVKNLSLAALDNSIEEDDELICNITIMNNEGFMMQIDRQRTNDFFYLFALNDLSEVEVFEEDDLEQAVEQEKLVPFYPFITNESSDKYGNLLYNSFVDTINHELITIEDHHVTNEQFIYLNAGEHSIEKGPQQIQLIEDYLDDTNEMYAEFDLNYKDIGKQLGFRATNDISSSKVIYFSEDYIVLFIDYNALITGTSGSTNVLIDLQDKENPTFYVVDLDFI